MTSDPPRPLTPEIRTGLLLLAVMALRVAVASTLGLGDAEAYYWTWSLHLAPSYYDHPPAIAWMIALTTALTGPTTLGVRLGPIVIFNITCMALFRLATLIHGSPRAGELTVQILCLTPVFFIGAMTASPDVLLACLWALFSLALYRSLTEAKLGAILSMGFLLGLAFLAKYFALLLIPGLVILLFSQAGRRLRSRPWALAASALLALALAAPVLWWNHDKGWPSLVYHLVARHKDAGLSWRNLGALVGGQLIYVSPFLLAGFAWAARETMRRWRLTPADPGPALLLALSIPPLAFFYGATLWTPEAEPHWPVLAYLALAVALGGLLVPAEKAGPSPRLRRWAVGWSLVTMALIHLHVLTPLGIWLTPMRAYEPRYDLPNELYGWPQVAERALAAARDMGPQAFALSYHYTMCSQLSFALKDRLQTYCPSDRLDQFDFMGLGEPPEGGYGVYIRDNRYTLPPEEAVPAFGPCEEVDPPLVLHRGGREVRRFRFHRCRGWGQLSPP